MPRSIQASRVQFRRDADAVGNLPTGSAASTYTWAFSNVPTRGIVRRVNVLITDTAVIPEVVTVDSLYFHTACTGGEGKDNTAAGDVTSVLAMFSWNMDHIDHLGCDQLFATSTYACSMTVSQIQGSTSAAKGNIDGAHEPTDITYDVSGTTLGPAQGTGTVYVTLSSPASGTVYTAFTGMTVTLDIEPLS